MTDTGISEDRGLLRRQNGSSKGWTIGSNNSGAHRLSSRPESVAGFIERALPGVTKAIFSTLGQVENAYPQHQ